MSKIPRRPRVWTGAVLGMVALVICWTGLFYITRRHDARGSRSSGVESEAGRVTILPGSGGESSQAAPSISKSSGMPPPDELNLRARDWLNAYSPKLSQEEEESLLAAHNRNERVLVALALMNNPDSVRSRAYIEEALGKAPDDPIVLSSALAVLRPHPPPSEEAAQRLEILEKLRTLCPDDAFPSIALATEALKKQDYEKTISLLQDAYDKDVFNESGRVVSQEQASLLMEAGRTKEQAMVRVFASEWDFAAPGPLFAEVYRLTSASNRTEEEGLLAALLSNVGQSINLKDDLPIWQQDFFLEQEKHLINALASDSTSGAFLSAPPSELLREIEAEQEVISPLLSISKAIVPVLQSLNSAQRTEFLELYYAESGVAALQWLSSSLPNTFSQFSERASSIRLYPSAYFWTEDLPQ